MCLEATAEHRQRQPREHTMPSGLGLCTKIDNLVEHKKIVCMVDVDFVAGGGVTGLIMVAQRSD